MKNDEGFIYLLFDSFYYFFFHLCAITLISFSGKNLTRKAEKVRSHFGAKINDLSFKKGLLMPSFNFLLIQFHARTLKVKTKFFEVNWNFFYAVSFFKDA